VIKKARFSGATQSQSFKQCDKFIMNWKSQWNDDEKKLYEYFDSLTPSLEKVEVASKYVKKDYQLYFAT
jgi:hypothetical protein